MRDIIYLPGETVHSMERIVEETAARLGVSVRQILGRQRSEKIARARQVAMWLGALDGSRSLPEVGRHFDRHHGTVMHARAVIEGLIADGRAFGLEAERLARRFGMISETGRTSPGRVIAKALKRDGAMQLPGGHP